MCCIVVEDNVGMRGIMTGDIETIGIEVGGAAKAGKGEDRGVGRKLMRSDIKKKTRKIRKIHNSCSRKKSSQLSKIAT